MRAFIPMRGGRGQGSKLQLTRLSGPRLWVWGGDGDPERGAPPAGCIMQFVQLKRQPGTAGKRRAVCVFLSPVPG